MKVALLAVFALAMIACQNDQFSEREAFLVTDDAAFQKLQQHYDGQLEVVESKNDQTVFRSGNNDIRDLSFDMHQLTNRCGGFFAFDSKEQALEGIIPGKNRRKKPVHPRVKYTITMKQKVSSLTNEVNPNNIVEMISKLSNYKNRYYRSPTGVESQAFVKKTWEGLNKRGSAFKVELFKHSSWPQPSVVATWTGSEKPEEIVVLGGHGDSINIRSFPADKAVAPGADDNASGVSTITEVIRVLMDSDYSPKRTLRFFAYAAEEVGLRGSRDIAKTYNKDKVNVIAVMQLDMTNHEASDQTISFIRDHTDDALSLFVQKLADMHLNIKWVNDKCGYACSDHASWTAEGYPSVMPFETRFKTMNPKIHSVNDTLAFSDGTGNHASHFAKLAIAYTMEIAK